MNSDRNNSSLSFEIPEIVIKPSRGWISLDLGDLWRYRELLFFLSWRDIKVRYKQTLLGVTWALLQPLLTMLLFSIIFGRLAGLPSEGVPYPIFTYTALLPWQLFSYALTMSSTSLVSDQSLITKVYFPRLVIPISSVIAGLLDFCLSLIVLLFMLVLYRIPLTNRMLILPFLVLFALLSAIAVGLWLAAFNVQYRDVRYALPFLTQFWMFATPIAYSITLIPERWRLVYGLNPMVGVVEGFRWALLGTSYSIGPIVLVSVLVVSVLLVGGLWYFKSMEDSFADVV